MSQSHLFLEEIYQKQIPVFSAIAMIAKESRFVNQQSIDGNIEIYTKPTSISIQKFKEDKIELVEIDNTNND